MSYKIPIPKFSKEEQILEPIHGKLPSTIHPSMYQFEGEDTWVVFVLGGPGAGKGTQCERMVEEYEFVHISAGDLLREERQRSGSQYGDLINNCLVNGLIVPKEITIALLKNAMRNSPVKRFLIDGFPREWDQGVMFEEQVCPCTCVLFFDCPEEVMERRLLKRGETSGREDDNIESIRKRFRTFREMSMLVVNHYQQLGKVYRIDASKEKEQVFQEVKRVFMHINVLEKSSQSPSRMTPSSLASPTPYFQPLLVGKTTHSSTTPSHSLHSSPSPLQHQQSQPSQQKSNTNHLNSSCPCTPSSNSA